MCRGGGPEPEARVSLSVGIFLERDGWESVS